ncbi:MAG: hypothetical protein KDE33_17505 [Bacteroidetes bacterium]|nr:hypothetical protein [Bacteroidota bacterium]
MGTSGFSEGVASYTSLAFKSSNEPYVVYSDLTQLYKATVMKFGNGTMSIEEQLNKSFFIYPNPADDMLYFSELLKNIEIYSINNQEIKTIRTNFEYSENTKHNKIDGPGIICRAIAKILFKNENNPQTLLNRSYFGIKQLCIFPKIHSVLYCRLGV